MNKANRIICSQGLPYRAKYETGGRGNCFFLAIADQLQNEEIRQAISRQGRAIPHDFESIRQQLVWYMRMNQDFHADEDVGVWLNVEKQQEDEAVEKGKKKGPKLSKHDIWVQYLKDMYKDGTWANEIVIKAAAWFFDIDILVIREDTNYPVYRSKIGGEESIREPHMALVFMDNSHFQSVHRVEKANNSRQNVPRQTSRPVPTNSETCKGCSAKVRQIQKHLAQKPECKGSYSKEDWVYLENKALKMRKASRDTYNQRHKAEINRKKVSSYRSIQDNKALRPDPFNSTVPRETGQVDGSWGSWEKHPPPKDGSDGWCHVCRRIFKHKTDAMKHAREVHQPKRFTCPNCSAAFTRQESLTKHVGTVHEKTAEQVCSMCDAKFVNKDSLTRHVHDIHEAKRDFKCSDCPLTFSRKDTRDKHEVRATVDSSKHGVAKDCNRCFKIIIFPTNAAYRRHSGPVWNLTTIRMTGQFR